MSIKAGDFVSGVNGYPLYEVMAVHGDMAWLRDAATGANWVAGYGHLKVKEKVDECDLPDDADAGDAGQACAELQATDEPAGGGHGQDA